MSSLSTDTRIVYIPVLYRNVNVSTFVTQTIEVCEGSDCYDEEEAEEEGRDLVATHVRDYPEEYCYCVVQKRIVPIWE